VEEKESSSGYSYYDSACCALKVDMVTECLPVLVKKIGVLRRNEIGLRKNALSFCSDL